MSSNQPVSVWRAWSLRLRLLVGQIVVLVVVCVGIIAATELALGTRGTVETAVGVRLPFTITEFTPGRRWSWTVAGIAATGHQVTAAPGGCRVRFEVPWWAAPYLAVCSVALGRIEVLATG